MTIADAKTWVKSNPKRTAIVAACVLAVLFVGYRVLRKPAESVVTTQTQVTTGSSHATTSVDVNTVTTEREREVTTKPDGTKTVKTKVRSTKSDTTAKRDEDAKVETRVETKIVKEPVKPAFLGLEVAADWDELKVAPSGFRVGADVSVGKLLGVQLRAGAEVHFPGNRATPNGGGVYLRAEIP